MKQNIVTRFAPSPTGFLHIGGVRTALFSFLFAKHNNGKFLLRIEDTDDKRLVEQSIHSIIEGLKWVNMHYDEQITIQSQNIKRHLEIANYLIEQKKAYYCYCSEEEIDIERKKQGVGYKYNGKCKSLTEEEKLLHSQTRKPVIRFDSSSFEYIEFDDLISGKAHYNKDNIDDFIILKSNQIPTFMFAVVIDDHDSKITHIIRGNDHHTNTVKHLMIYDALNWPRPTYAHLPLIMNEDGTKMSKRKNAVDIIDYKKNGFLPEALLNYLLLLGFSPQNEILNLQQMILEFDIKKVHNSPARFCIDKLKNINQQYMIQTEAESIIQMIKENNFINDNIIIDEKFWTRIKYSLTEITKRVFLLNEIIDSSKFYAKNWQDFINADTKEFLKKFDKKTLLTIKEHIFTNNQKQWNKNQIEQIIVNCSTKFNIKKADIMKILRSVLTGIFNSYSIAFIMEILGYEESLSRFNTILNSI